ncbi:MAG TPA: class I SAM-dependent methyltransferase [Chthoniobacterales bacterium]|jgi:hypothetical protein
MSDPAVAAAFAELQPWITKYELRGETSGGWFDAPNDSRIVLFRRAFPTARRILELGALEGGHTVGLSRLPGVEHVLGVEGRETNYRRALAAKKVFAINNADFLLGNLEELSLRALGLFDVIFCCGLLYHLPRPWELVKQFSAVAGGLFLWTHYASEDKASDPILSYHGYHQPEGGLDDALSGLSGNSFWPTLESLCTMLADFGFAEIKLLEDNPAHVNGPAITLAAYTR